MPKVGNKHYSYDAKGRAAAKKESRRTGKAMTNTTAKKGTRKK